MNNIDLMKLNTPLLDSCRQALSEGSGKLKNLSCNRVHQLFNFLDELDTNLYTDEDYPKQWKKIKRKYDNLDTKEYLPAKLKDFIGKI